MILTPLRRCHHGQQRTEAEALRSIRKNVLACVMLPVAITATGCASHPPPLATPTVGYSANGSVSADIQEADAAARYQPVPGSDYLSPVANPANASPVYPAGLLTQRLPPVQVVVRLIVDATGGVIDARIAADKGGEPPFAEAVLVAVRGWRFTPLQRVTGTRLEALPFTEDYRFTFRQVNGHAVVETE